MELLRFPDCTLTVIMLFPFRIQKTAVGAALAALVVVGAGLLFSSAQQAVLARPALSIPSLRQMPPCPGESSPYALPLPEDRGQADLEQTLKRLGTTASVLFIDAHPDDEDGALLTYLTARRGRARHR